MDKRVLIVGAGGIGSWLAEHLHKLQKNSGQLKDVTFTFADFDTVEIKNLKYQNFDKVDILDNKAKVIAVKFISDKINGIDKKIDNEKDLKNYDCIVSAVDNAKFREFLFRFAEKNKKVYWIDLRSEGRAVAFYTKNKKNTLDKMLATLPKEDDANSSCQLQFELDNDIIQCGNRIVASIGAQLLLNWYRNDFNPAEFTWRF